MALVDPHPELGDPTGLTVLRGARGPVVDVDRDGAPVVLDDLDADQLLQLAAEAESQAWAAERRKLRYAYQWCVLHPAPDADLQETWAGSEVAVGGEGAPGVAEGAAARLGAALRMTTAAAMQLMADALDLRHRLPATWARVEALEVPPWRARRLAQATAALDRAAAREVDRRLAEVIGSCGTRRIETTIADVVARMDPEGQAVAEDAAEDQWGTRLTHGRGSFYEGTSTLEVVGDTLDLTAFADLLGAVAHQSLDPEAPDAGPADLEKRKARALGVIAQRAFAGVSVLDGEAPARPAARARLYLHLDAAELTPDATGVGAVEDLGAVTTAKIRDWLGVSRATILPVLHLDSRDAVDQHDPPAWMRELVILRDHSCVFPECQVGARSCDLDHVVPYDPLGPPGQTNPANLAPLCRCHHRHKTFGGWSYARHPDGTYTWRSPDGRSYLVDHGRTHALG